MTVYVLALLFVSVVFSVIGEKAARRLHWRSAMWCAFVAGFFLSLAIVAGYMLFLTLNPSIFAS